MSEVTYTCLCCKYTERFPTEAAAFKRGWDTPSAFTVAPLCNLCPLTTFLLRQHDAIHAVWEREGTRPESFGPHCLPADVEGSDPRDFARIQQWGQRLHDALRRDDEEEVRRLLEAAIRGTDTD